MKVEKVWDWPIPTNTKQVHSFLGLASYYQRFIPKFTKILPSVYTSWLVLHPTNIKKLEVRRKAACTEITGPKEFKWMPEHQQAFDALKKP